MGFIETVKYNFTHYADFKGRAPRSQFWWWFLFNLIVYAILNVIDNAAGFNIMQLPDNGASVPVAIYGGGVLATIWGLALLLPTLAVSARRLHDTDKSGWWLLLYLICCIGNIILLIFFLLPGNRTENRFGPDPLAS